MQIGDKLMLRPTVFGGGADLIDTQPRPCRVVYITRCDAFSSWSSKRN